MDVDKKTRLEPFSFPDGTYNIFCLENGFCTTFGPFVLPVS